MKNNKAFTLIELIVVIAILAGFVALLFPNFMEVRMKARDVQRKNDIKSLQKALELYKQNQTLPVYPAALPSTCGTLSDASVVYMQKIPQEPLTRCGVDAKNYYYVRNVADNGRYTLAACLEITNDPTAVNCPADFLANTTFTCTGNKCYQLSEP
jgi:prepilin-type N-terminal cleavage/methylation domain-containing protein